MKTIRLEQILLCAVIALTTRAVSLGNTDTNAKAGAVSEAQSSESQHHDASTRATVAVMPWRALDEKTFDPQDSHWLKTFTGLVRGELGLVSRLKVVNGEILARELTRVKQNGHTNLTSVQGYKLLSEQLEGDWLIKGAMAHEGQSWMIQMQILDAAGHESGELFRASSTNLFELREQAAEQVLHCLDITPSAQEQERLRKPWTSSPQALELASRAGLLFHEDDPARAVDLFRKALAIDPRFVQARSFLAVALYNLGREDEALSEARKSLSQDPDDSHAAKLHLVAAYLLAHRREFDKADDEVVEGLRVWAEDTELLLLHAAFRKDVEDFEGAGAALRAAVIGDPRNPRIHARLAELEFLQGDVTNALKRLELAGSLAQEAPEPVDCEVEFALADAYRVSGNFSRALQHYQRWLAAAGDAHAPEVRLSAIREKVEKLDPDSVWVRKSLVRALIDSGQFDEARQELDAVRRNHPEDWEGYQLEGWLACRQNRLGEGIVWLRKSKAANPASGDTRLLLAEALFHSGKQAAAREEFAAGLRRPHQHFNVAMARQRLRVLDDALRPAGNVAGSLEPAAHAGSYYELGLSYLSGSTPNAAEAVKWLRKAADMGFSKAQCELGYQYWIGGGVSQNLATAVSWWQKAAGQGEPQSMRNLAIAYDNGMGVTKNPKEALRWMRRAAEGGDSQAQMMLGKGYYEGKEVPKDLAQALFWLSQATESETNSSTAQFGGRHPTSLQSEGRALLKEVMLFATPNEVQKASAIMEEYRAKHTSTPAKK